MVLHSDHLVQSCLTEGITRYSFSKLICLHERTISIFLRRKVTLVYLACYFFRGDRHHPHCDV